MGGKGGTAPPEVQVPDTSLQNEQMMQMMSMMMQSMSSMQVQPPPLLEAPEVRADPEVDWKEKQDQLAAKAGADYKLDRDRQVGRTDTILTSPLLDEELDESEGSLLSS